MATQKLEDRQTESLVKGIDIPPQPAILRDIAAEQRKEYPDLNRVATLLSRDVGLSASVLKTVNSPFFGLRQKTGSIRHAVMLLGFENVVNVVTSLSLRLTLEGKTDRRLGGFWDWATDSALISAALARRLSRIEPDEAYTLGLFHDCGIPLMMKRFEDYGETLQEARADPAKSLAEFEEERYGTGHAVVGYYLARSWNLPKRVAQAILVHHDLEAFRDSDEDVRTLVALVRLGSHLCHVYRSFAFDPEWTHFKDAVLAQLVLGDLDLEELEADIGAMLSGT